MSMFQKTLAHAVSLKGIGVHSGKEATCSFIPAQAGEGIRFIHQNNKQEIMVGKVIPEGCLFATVLSVEGWRLSTVEHLLAALYALGIDALAIVIDGDEVPILDGSALDFVKLFQRTGTVELLQNKKKISVKESLFLGNNEQSITLLPGAHEQKSGVELLIELDRDPSLFGGAIKTSFSFVDQDFFLKQIVPARTFGRFEQRDYLLAQGYGLGASIENTLVFKEGVWVQEKRFYDEPVRHKVLDFMGDLMLLGAVFEGNIEVRNPSHSLNRLMIKHFIEHPEKWVLR